MKDLESLTIPCTCGPLARPIECTDETVTALGLLARGPSWHHCERCGREVVARDAQPHRFSHGGGGAS